MGGPGRSVAAGLIVVFLLAGLEALVPPPASADDRSTVRFLHRCTNEIGRREVTLFANGTVRLRQGSWESQELWLEELLPEELESVLDRLAEVESSMGELGTVGETGAIEQPAPRGGTVGSDPHRGVLGRWVERCEIVIALPDRRRRTLRFSPSEIPPLQVAALGLVADDLASFTRPPVPEEHLPADYEPRPGDVLRGADGQLFEVLRFTADKRGIELQGVDSPLRIFVGLEQLGEAFVGVEELAQR
jgi:hypothetical protein